MKEFFYNIKCVWKYSKDEKMKIVIYFILSIFGVIASIIYPIISAKIIVNLTDNKIRQFVYMGIIFTSIVILNDIINFSKSMLYEKIFRKVYTNIQYNLGSEILKLTNKTLNENSSGVFIQRLVGDTRTISTIFTDINTYINGILTNIGVLITYFILSKPMFIFALISFSIRLIIETIRINKYNKNDKEYRKENDEITGFSGELVRGAKDIKMLNGESSFLNELKNKFVSLNFMHYKKESTNLIYLLFRWIWAELSYFIMIVIVAISVNNEQISIPVGVVIFNFGNRYNMLVGYIINFYELIKKFNLSATRIFEIFKSSKYEKETFGKEHLSKIDGNFEFKNVSFKYDKKQVLNNINFNVKSNETVAFVGKSGAGKTTIFNLLCKMYDSYNGTITIDGTDIKNLDKDTIRGNITIVSQSPYIFNMSIRENLRLVKQDLTDEEMKQACKMACLDDYIEQLPQKYDTIVGEGGVTLSGGQKQRLAIARAFVQKTEIILLDEATSNLDNETQLKIQQAIENLQKEYTILIIAHRLSTVRNADRILMLSEGKIIAEGNHSKLIKECKQYRDLYENEIIKKV